MNWKTVLVAIILFIPGCNKNPGVDQDVSAPVITINTPVASQVFTNGQSILISGTINDDKFIAEVHIHVFNTNTGALLMDVHLFPANARTTFNQAFTAVSGVNYKIQVIAKDRAVNEARNSVEVSCN